MAGRFRGFRMQGAAMSLVYRSTSALPGLEALSCRDDFPFSGHLHSGHVVWLNSEGGEYFSLRGNSAVLQPGHLSIIEAGVVHANRPCSAGRRHLRSFYLEEEFFADLAGRLELGRPPDLASTTVADPGLWREMAAFHQAVIAGADDFAVENAMVAVFGRLLARCGAAPKQEGELRDNGPRLERAIACLRERLDEPVSLASLAEIAGCSAGHLIRLFKARVGMTPHGYLIQLRLERARRLIAGGVAIADAACQSGFADQSHLSRKFRLRYGITPKAYGIQQRRS